MTTIKPPIAADRLRKVADPWNHNQYNSCRAGNLSDHAARNPAPNILTAADSFPVDEVKCFNSLVEKYDSEH